MPKPSAPSLNSQPSQPSQPFYDGGYRGFMAKLKFKSNVARCSQDKTKDAYIDSGATHHFFHSRSSFTNYKSIDTENVKAASGFSKIVGKGTVRLPVDGEITIEAYHAPEFSSNIIFVGLISISYRVLSDNDTRDYPACFFLRRGAFDIISEFKLEDNLYPMKFPPYNH
eukprot:IDg1071t1